MIEVNGIKCVYIVYCDSAITRMSDVPRGVNAENN